MIKCPASIVVEGRRYQCDLFMEHGDHDEHEDRKQNYAWFDPNSKRRVSSFIKESEPYKAITFSCQHILRQVEREYENAFLDGKRLGEKEERIRIINAIKKRAEKDQAAGILMGLVAYLEREEA